MSVYIKPRTGATGKRWVVYFRRGGRGYPEEYAGSFPTEKLAKLRRDLIAGELAAGRDPRRLLEEMRAPRVQPAGLLRVWDEFAASRIDVSRSTASLYRNGRDRIVPLLGEDRDPHSIRPADVQDAIGQLADLAPGSVRQYVSTLGQIARRELLFGSTKPFAALSRTVRARGGRGTVAWCGTGAAQGVWA